MAHVHKGQLTESPQWAKHLKGWKRVFWKAERQAGRSAAWQESIGSGEDGHLADCNSAQLGSIPSDSSNWQKELSTLTTTKIVYNACYGGFGLSREAVLRGRELSNDPTWGGPCLKGDAWGSPDGAVCERDYSGGDRVPRTDPILIQVVEELGPKADGPYAELKIDEIEKGESYRIDEYDGNESVRTIADYVWQTA